MKTYLLFLVLSFLPLVLLALLVSRLRPRVRTLEELKEIAAKDSDRAVELAIRSLGLPSVAAVVSDPVWSQERLKGARERLEFVRSNTGDVPPSFVMGLETAERLIAELESTALIPSTSVRYVRAVSASLLAERIQEALANIWRGRQSFQTVKS